MKRILVTGANKGIGLAVVEQILRDQPSCNVILGTRNLARGESARAALVSQDPAYAGRLELLEIDLGSNASISRALQAFDERWGDERPPLYGLVNNAGAGSGSLEEILQVNVRAVQRLTERFAPKLEPGSRIVNVTSASGPNFVARCTPPRVAFFLRNDVDWEEMEAFMDKCLQLEPAGWSSLGIDSDSRYGLSKACGNTYTLDAARRYPLISINACTPGFIETDLGKAFLGARTPAEAGMKSPAEGAQVIMRLLFDYVVGSGYYFGSDGCRSPMDRYRAPGSPPYSGS